LLRKSRASKAGSFSTGRGSMRGVIRGLGSSIRCFVTREGLRKVGRLIRRGIGGGRTVRGGTGGGVGVGGGRIVRGSRGGGGVNAGALGGTGRANRGSRADISVIRRAD